MGRYPPIQPSERLIFLAPALIRVDGPSLCAAQTEKAPNVVVAGVSEDDVGLVMIQLHVEAYRASSRYMRSLVYFPGN